MSVINQISSSNTFLEWLTSTQALIDHTNTYANVIVYISTEPSTNKGQSGNEKGQVYLGNNFLYYCTADYDGTSNIWSRIASSNTW
jgi:hypothetical protein